MSKITKIDILYENVTKDDIMGSKLFYDQKLKLLDILENKEYHRKKHERNIERLSKRIESK